ncbi:hypothetical protein [Alkalibacterium indicireducens]|uniref:Toxin-antitoxin system HicB family antitoxin n=1 Tax=Alkalibacterium indicireducens TaxID=398758 RepID=A0ABN1B4X8_9LACT
MSDKKRINITMSEKLHIELKKAAIDEGTTLSGLLEIIGKEFLEKRTTSKIKDTSN